MLKIWYLLTWIYCGCSSKIDRPRISLALICTYDYTYLCKAWKNYDAVSVTNTLMYLIRLCSRKYEWMKQIAYLAEAPHIFIHNMIRLLETSPYQRMKNKIKAVIFDRLLVESGPRNSFVVVRNILFCRLPNFKCIPSSFRFRQVYTCLLNCIKSHHKFLSDTNYVICVF